MLNNLVDISEAMQSTSVKLEKAEFILNQWFNEYSFQAKPDPQAAVKWSASLPGSRNEDVTGSQAYKWFWDYDRIYNLLSIVSDYVGESKALLNQTIMNNPEE